MLEHEGEPVACGGWSRRDRLYAGSGEAVEDSRLLDPETEPAKVRADVRALRLDASRPWPSYPRGVRGGRAAGGFRRLALMATLPGVPLYRACGFEPLEDVEVVLEDGVRLACVAMEKSVSHRV